MPLNKLPNLRRVEGGKWNGDYHTQYANLPPSWRVCIRYSVPKIADKCHSFNLTQNIIRREEGIRVGQIVGTETASGSSSGSGGGGISSSTILNCSNKCFSSFPFICLCSSAVYESILKRMKDNTGWRCRGTIISRCVPPLDSWINCGILDIKRFLSFCLTIIKQQR